MLPISKTNARFSFGAHYTRLGGIFKAEVQAAALFRGFPPITKSGPDNVIVFSIKGSRAQIITAHGAGLTEPNSLLS